MNYQEMNREERYFCFLLGHALLVSNAFREEFCSKIGIANSDLEVYPEAAWLRDYWHSCDYEIGGGVGRRRLSSSPEKLREKSRRDCLVKILCIVLDDSDPQKRANLLELNDAFFWSKGEQGKGEIITPGRWSLKLLEGTAFPDELINLKWAFNSKPDLMLVSDKDYCLIEAKVESYEDVYKCNVCEAPQTKIQKLVGKLVTGLSEGFNPAKNIMLSRKDVTDTTSILWESVVEMIEIHRGELDVFTVDAFRKSPFLRKI